MSTEPISVTVEVDGVTYTGTLAESWQVNALRTAVSNRKNPIEAIGFLINTACLFAEHPVRKSAWVEYIGQPNP